MYVAELWRYPAKSMAGEQLQNAHMTPSGIEGDRVIQVQNARGRTITSRTHPGLLGHRATLDAQGSPLVDGRPWRDLEVLAEIRQIAGPGAQLVYDDSLDRLFGTSGGYLMDLYREPLDDLDLRSRRPARTRFNG